MAGSSRSRVRRSCPLPAAGPGRAGHPQRLPRQQGSAVDRHRRAGHRATSTATTVVRYTMQEGLVNDFVARLLRGSRGRHLDRHRRRPQLLARRNASAASRRHRSHLRQHPRLAARSRRQPLGGDRARLHAVPIGRLRQRSAARAAARHEGLGAPPGLRTRTLDRHAGRRALPLKAGRLTQFTTEHGLPSNKIHFVGEDGCGNLWMSGPSGVVSVVAARSRIAARRNASRHVPVRLYDTTEGLNTNQMSGGVQPAGVVTTTGEIWLPSTKGAVLIIPDVPERPSRLPVVIEQAIADGRADSVSDRARAPARRRQARDPVHVASPRGAGTAPLQILDGRLRARLDGRRPAPRRVLHQPAAGRLPVSRRGLRHERAAECRRKRPRDPPATAFVPDEIGSWRSAACWWPPRRGARTGCTSAISAGSLPPCSRSATVSLEKCTTR